MPPIRDPQRSYGCALASVPVATHLVCEMTAKHCSASVLRYRSWCSIRSPREIRSTGEPGPEAVPVSHTVSQEAWPCLHESARCLWQDFIVKWAGICLARNNPLFARIAVERVFLAWLTHFNRLWRSGTSSNASASLFIQRGMAMQHEPTDMACFSSCSF